VQNISGLNAPTCMAHSKLMDYINDGAKIISHSSTLSKGSDLVQWFFPSGFGF
jgi:hypothetical protein